MGAELELLDSASHWLWLHLLLLSLPSPYQQQWALATTGTDAVLGKGLVQTTQPKNWYLEQG